MIYEALYFADEGMVWETKCEYDAAGNLTRAATYDADGKLQGGGFRYEYDATGNKTRETYYDAADKLTKENRYEYDATGNMFRKAHLDGSGRLEYEYRYENYQAVPFAVKELP